MRKGPIYENIINDKLLLMLASLLYTNLGDKRKLDISQRLRLCCRLKLTIDMDIDFIDLLVAENFDTIISAVYQISGKHENEFNMPTMESPSLALRLGNFIVKLAEL